MDAKTMPMGHFDYQDWLARPFVQSELPRLNTLVDDLGSDVLGLAFDHQSQKVVVVADPQAFVDGSIGRALHDAALHMPLRLQPSCHSVITINQVGQKLRERDWYAGVRETSFTMGIDVERGKWVVTGAPFAQTALAPRNGSELQAIVNDVQTALNKQFNGLVDFEWGEPAPHGRFDDGSPHFAGAAIQNSSGRTCTAGPMVIRGGVRQAVTAGHCYSNGVSVSSGAKAYGITAGRAAFPKYDMIRIAPNTGESFSNNSMFYIGTSTTRRQKAKAKPAVGGFVCISGRNAGFNCGAAVNSCTEFFCPGGGDCTEEVCKATKTGTVLTKPGDSGAPVFSDWGNGIDATVNGMNLGQGATSSTIFFHHSNALEAQLGVTIAL